MSLSQLHPKAVKSQSHGEFLRSEPKPEVKKTINFIELKKVLADSFAPKKIISDEENSGTLRDRTGMLKPRDATTLPKKPEAQVLKPGDKITFK